LESVVARETAAGTCSEVLLAHEPRHALATYPLAGRLEFGVNAGATVAPLAGHVSGGHLLGQFLVAASVR
jgi:hypothetical protein